MFCRDKAIQHLGKDVILYTTDGDGAGYLKCGKIPGVYATVDFGSGADAANAFHQQRLYEPHGKLKVQRIYLIRALLYCSLNKCNFDIHISIIFNFQDHL